MKNTCSKIDRKKNDFHSPPTHILGMCILRTQRDHLNSQLLVGDKERENHVFWVREEITI